MNPRMLINLTGDRIATLPLAIVYVTDRCNSRCVTCDYWQFGRTNMPVARARSLAAELVGMGTSAVLLSGGEPLLHPEWESIAAIFRSVGMKVWLLTAGLALAREAEQMAAVVDQVTISLDGATAETYESIRGVAAFDKVIAGARSLTELGVPTSFRTTVQRGNYRELPAIVRLAHKIGVDQISFLAVDVSTHIAFARAEDYNRTMALTAEDLPDFAAVLDELESEFEPDFASGFIAESPAKLRNLHAYFAALLHATEGSETEGVSNYISPVCNAPRFSAVIGADGNLQPCYFISGPKSQNGAPLRERLNTAEFVDLRRTIRTGRRHECTRCVCSMHKSARELVLGNPFPD